MDVATAKEQQEPPETGEAGGILPQRFRRECDPVGNFRLKFWLPELGGSEFLLFSAASSVRFIMAAQASGPPGPTVAQALDFTLALKDS